MANRRILVLIAVLPVLVLTLAVKWGEDDFWHLVLGVAVSGCLLALVHWVTKKGMIHSLSVYLVALSLAATAGLLAYLVPAPLPGSIGLKLLFSVVAGFSAPISILLLARLIKRPFAPWERGAMHAASSRDEKQA